MRRRFRGTLDLLRACETARERLHLVLWLAAYALLKLAGRRPIEHTSRVGGLVLTLDWAAAEHVPIREILGRKEYWPSAFWVPRKGETVVDAGANAGIFTVAAARKVGPGGRVVAVEPNPGPAARLARNVAANGVTDRVAIVTSALGERRRQGWVSVGRNSTIASVLDDASGGHDIEVKVRRLDDLLIELGIESIDLLKIDVEGSEERLLAGAKQALTRTGRVVVEVSSMDGYRRVLANCLAAGLDTQELRRAGPDSGGWVLLAARSNALSG